MIFRPVGEAAAANLALRVGWWTTAFTVGLALLPGFGIFAFLRNIIKVARSLLPGRVAQAEKIELFSKHTDKDYVEKNKREDKRVIKMLPEVPREKMSELLKENAKKELVVVAPKKKKKRRPKPRMVEVVESCVVCNDTSTMTCTHCADGRSYCGNECVILDWDVNTNQHRKYVE